MKAEKQEDERHSKRRGSRLLRANDIAATCTASSEAVTLPSAGACDETICLVMVNAMPIPPPEPLPDPSPAQDAPPPGEMPEPVPTPDFPAPQPPDPPGTPPEPIVARMRM